MGSVSYTTLASATALFVATPAVGYAQTAPASGTTQSGAQTADVSPVEAEETGTIVVTARRRAEAASDVPASINVVTGEQAGQFNFRTFNDIEAVVPGLTFNSQIYGTGDGAQLRGVAFDAAASGNNPTVEFYFNDAPIAAGVILQQLYDVDQIEVLRGPQGTLRGRASPSGSITITSKMPSLVEAGGNVSETVNDIGTININGALGVPIIEGKLAVRVAGVVQQDDFNRVSTIKSTLDRRDPYSNARSGRISLVAEPFDALRLNGVVQILKHDFRAFDQVESFSAVNANAPTSPVFIAANDRLSNEETPRSVKQVYRIYNGRAELSQFGQRLIYQFQHYTQNVYSKVPQDVADVFPGYDYFQFTNTRTRSTSHEIRFENDAPVFGIVDYVAGFFNIINDTPTNLTIQTPVFLPALLGESLVSTANTDVQRRGHSNEKSYFGNVAVHIDNVTEIAGGLRYIHYNSTGSTNIAGVAVADPVRRDDDHFIYTISAKRFLNAATMIYANTGTSFRPGIDPVGDFSVAPSERETGFLHLESETSQSSEIGLKAKIFGGRGYLNLVGFHQTFKNYPYRVPGSGVYYINYAAALANGQVTVTQQVSQFNFVAAVPVTINGVEGEFGYDVSNRFKIGVTGAYALGSIKNAIVPCTDLNGDGVGDVITTAPTLGQLQAAYGANNLGACRTSQRSSLQSPFSFSVRGEYDVPVSRLVAGYLRGLVSVYGKAQGDPQNIFDNVPTYALANIYGGIHDIQGRWEISLFAKNVFNNASVLTRSNPLSTTYRVLQPPTFRAAAAVTTTSTYTPITTTIPREIGLNVRFNFGTR